MKAITPVKQAKTLFISAGHSSTDPGAVGNGHTEAQIVTEFRNLVAIELDKMGIDFDTDGAGSENLPLRTAAQWASRRDIAIEWHCNAFSNPAATGTETLSAGHHYPLAAKLCEVTADCLGIKNRGTKGESSGQHSRLAFINTGGGIIHELFFITNRSDLHRYLNNREQLAYEIAQVLAQEVRS